MIRSILCGEKKESYHRNSPIEGSFRSLSFSRPPPSQRMTREKVEEQPARQIAGHCDPDRLATFVDAGLLSTVASSRGG